MIDFMLFGVFDYGQTDGLTDERTDICTSRVAVATENSLFQDIIQIKIDHPSYPIFETKQVLLKKHCQHYTVFHPLGIFRYCKC